MKIFKKGPTVKFKINTAFGTSRGKGTVTFPVPRHAVAGSARLTVKDKNGKIWKPYPGQCVAA